MQVRWDPHFQADTCRATAAVFRADGGPAQCVQDPYFRYLLAGVQQNASSQQTGSTAVSKQKEKRGTHIFEDDPRNLNIMIGLRDGVTGLA